MIFATNISIKPQPKQSVKKGIHAFYTDPKKRTYVNFIRDVLTVHAKRQRWELRKKDVPISAIINFHFKSEKKGPNLNNVNVDNLLKPILDAAQGIIYENDSQVFNVESEKRFSDANGIEIMFISGD